MPMKLVAGRGDRVATASQHALTVATRATLHGSWEVDWNLRPPLSCSMEMCDQRHNITMCPLCDKTCSYWKMSSACATARASHLFDNPATVFFSVFMALWGKWILPFEPPTWQGQEHSLLTLNLMVHRVCVLGVKVGHIVCLMATDLHHVQDGHSSLALLTWPKGVRVGQDLRSPACGLSLRGS